MSARTKEELEQLRDTFVSPSNKPIILEVFTEAENQRKAISMVASACWNGSDKDILIRKNKETVKKVVNSVLGDSGVNTLKNIVNKIK